VLDQRHFKTVGFGKISGLVVGVVISVGEQYIISIVTAWSAPRNEAQDRTDRRILGVSS